MFWVCDVFDSGQIKGPFRTELNAEDFCKYMSEKGLTFKVMSEEYLAARADSLERLLQVYFEEHVEW